MRSFAFFSDLLDKPWSQVDVSPPPVLTFSFVAHRVQHFHISAFYARRLSSNFVLCAWYQYIPDSPGIYILYASVAEDLLEINMKAHAVVGRGEKSLVSHPRSEVSLERENEKEKAQRLQTA